MERLLTAADIPRAINLDLSQRDWKSRRVETGAQSSDALGSLPKKARMKATFSGELRMRAKKYVFSIVMSKRFLSRQKVECPLLFAPGELHMRAKKYVLWIVIFENGP